MGGYFKNISFSIFRRETSLVNHVASSSANADRRTALPCRVTEIVYFNSALSYHFHDYVLTQI